VPEASGPIIEQTSTRVVYETPHMRLREDGIRRPDGSAGIYSYVEKPDFALIIPVENDGFHLVEQYRYPVRMRCWEFPQGTLPDMAVAADPEKLAREELRQETGMTASVLRHLGHLHCAHGLVSQGFDVFVAAGLEPGTPELELEEQDKYDHPRQSRAQVAAGMPPIRAAFTGENHLLVARQAAESEALGMCWCVLFDPGTGLEGEVAELYVTPAARGRGIASALLRGAMELFRERRVTFACVWTRDDNPAAMAAYRAAGFTPTEQTVLTWLPLDGG